MKSRKEEIERVNVRDTETEKKLKDTQNDVLNAKGEFRRNQQLLEDLESKNEQLEKERSIRSSKVDEVAGLIDSKRLGSVLVHKSQTFFLIENDIRILTHNKTSHNFFIARVDAFADREVRFCRNESKSKVLLVFMKQN